MMQKKVFILSACFLLLLCSMVMSNAESAPEYVPNELIVKYKSAVEQDMSISIATDNVHQPSLAALNQKHKIIKATPLYGKRAGKTTSEGSAMVLDSVNKARTEKGLPATDTFTDISNIYLLKVEEGTDILAAVSEFSDDENVEYAEPNYIFTTSEATPPNAMTAKDGWIFLNISYFRPRMFDQFLGKIPYFIDFPHTRGRIAYLFLLFF